VYFGPFQARRFEDAVTVPMVYGFGRQLQLIADAAMRDGEGNIQNERTALGTPRSVFAGDPDLQRQISSM
jgi:hypothetical protein